MTRDAFTVDLEFQLSGDPSSEPLHEAVVVGTNVRWIVPTGPESDDGTRERVDALVNLVRRLAVDGNSTYVWSFHAEGPTTAAAVTASSADVVGEIGSIPWPGVYGPDVVEDLGGREHVLDTSAPRVESWTPDRC